MKEMNFEQFFKHNEGRIHYQIRRLGIKQDWYDDFYSEAILALWEAYKDFDHQKGNLGTFINYKIRYRLIDLLRKKIREQETLQKTLEQAQTTQQNGNYHRGTGRPLIDPKGIEVQDDYFWKKVRSRLTHKQWLWVKYFIIADLTIKEIMEIEQVSADAVKSWGKEVRKKLRKEPLWEWLDR